eukprot:6462351-Amphidinium_carterae.1
MARGEGCSSQRVGWEGRCPVVTAPSFLGEDRLMKRSSSSVLLRELMDQSQPLIPKFPREEDPFLQEIFGRGLGEGRENWLPVFLPRMMRFPHVVNTASPRPCVVL